MIIIDPGHGGNDPGAVGPTGTKEKDVALNISLCLANLLEWLGHEVKLTRTHDVKPNWPDRVKSNKEDIFVSIHCNAVDNEDVHGTETFHYTGSTEGEKVAEAVHRRLKGVARDRGVKDSQEFYVLRKTKCPAILVETDFISNPEREKLLASRRYQMRLASLIAAGIDQYKEG